MSTTDATTFPRAELRDRQPAWRRFGRFPTLNGAHLRIGTREEAGKRFAAFTLLYIVVCCVLIVFAAAARPSLLAAVTRPGYFPGWMAGPLGGMWSSLTRNAEVLRYGVSAAMISMYACYIVALKYVPRLRARWTIAAIVVVHLVFFLAPPMMLTDIFNYINYGRMEVVHHLNPYTSVPVLEPHLDPSFSISNWHGLSSPYGPLFTIITLAVVPLGVAGSFWVLKALLLVSSLTCILLLWKSAELLGRNPTRAIFFLGMNPIVLMWGLGGDHNDFVMLLFIVLAFYLLLRSSRYRGLTDDNGVAGDAHAAAPPALDLGLAAHPVLTRARPGSLLTRVRSVLPFVAPAPPHSHLPDGNGFVSLADDSHGGNGFASLEDDSPGGNGFVSLADDSPGGNGFVSLVDDSPGGNGFVSLGDDSPGGNGFVSLARDSHPEPHAEDQPAALTANGNGAGPGANGAAPHANGHVSLRARRVPPVALEIAAGASLVTAVTIKASAAIILPAVLAGLARHPRRLLQVLLGIAVAAAVLGTCSLIAFGPHLPSLGTQGSVVTEVSLPNLLGFALGQGGETNVLREILSVVLVLAVATSAWLAWRWRDSLTAAGWATVALVVTLSWVLPWYVLWVLPLAALSSSRRLRRATLLVGAYLIMVWLPISGSLFNAIGFHPSHTTLGQAHKLEISELMR
jgi:hypothetical protein